MIKQGIQKKYRFGKWPAVLVYLVCVLGIAFWGVNRYRWAVYEYFSGFCALFVEEHPEAEAEVISCVKAYDVLPKCGSQFLEQYGYKGSEFLEGIAWEALAFFAVWAGLLAGGFLLFLYCREKNYRKRIVELTEYLEQVNTGDSGTILQVREDVFSHLQDEMYKTVTALYQTREHAVEAKKNFAENLANIAHQLKTPISALFLSMQLMEKETPHAGTEQMKRQLERLYRLEESLLMLAKIDAGILRLEREKVDLYTALNLAAENLEELLAKKKISVEIPERGCVEINGDLEWTMEAFLNLIKNCMEHSKPGQSVHCDYFQNPLYAEVLIWDEGTGIAKEDLPHLFERFYRGKGAADGGVGIGLALARSILELENGSIAVRNLPEGGACFEIRIYSH